MYYTILLASCQQTTCVWRVQSMLARDIC